MNPGPDGPANRRGRTMPQSDDFVLTVIAGPNAGASASMRGGRFVLGGGKDDDIILDGVNDAALSMTLDGNRARLAPAAADVLVGESLSSGQPIAAGTAQVVTLPTIMRLGSDTIVSLARRRPDTRGQMRLGIAATVATLALVGGTALGMQLGDNAPAISAGAVAAPTVETASAGPAAPPVEVAAVTAPAKVLPDKVTLPGAPEEAAPPAAATATPAVALASTTPATPGLNATSPRIGPCRDDCLKDAAAGLREGLDAQGLGSIAVEPTDGVLKVSGSLASDQMQAWERLRTRFEAEFGQSLPLIVSLNDAAEAPALAVASVWLGALPEVRTKTGQVLRVGDATPDGWTVRSIGKGQIALARGSREITVNF